MLQETVAEKVHTLRDAATDNRGRGRTEGPLKEPIPPQRQKTAGTQFFQNGAFMAFPMASLRFVLNMEANLSEGCSMPQMTQTEERNDTWRKGSFKWQSSTAVKEKMSEVQKKQHQRFDSHFVREIASSCKYYRFAAQWLTNIFTNLVLNDHICPCANLFSDPLKMSTSGGYVYQFWANYNNSLTWIKAIWGWFPLLTMISSEVAVRSL